ncbi:MAG: hypothetical protein K6A92_08475 [Lachnospiraceae bacterium]|nr:hypothetical protein [Lachnospiraceae bacterium]
MDAEKDVTTKKKARLKRKRRIQAAVLVLVLAAGGLGYRYYSIRQAEKEAQAEAAVEILVEEGQSVIYAQIDEIYGNEMTYTVLEETEDTADTEGNFTPEGRPDRGSLEAAPEGEDTTTSLESDGTEYTETVMNAIYASGAESVILTTAGMGGAPGSGSMGGGSMGGGFPGGGASGTGAPGGSFGGDLPGEEGQGGFNPFGSSGETEDGTVTIGEKTYTPGDTQETVLIPVGTSVTTKLGTETTFSRLSAGNAIAMVLQEGEIVRIYIVG